jgi:hypothetical protein
MYTFKETSQGIEISNWEKSLLIKDQDDCDIFLNEFKKLRGDIEAEQIYLSDCFLSLLD